MEDRLLQFYWSELEKARHELRLQQRLDPGVGTYRTQVGYWPSPQMEFARNYNLPFLAQPFPQPSQVNIFCPIPIPLNNANYLVRENIPVPDSEQIAAARDLIEISKDKKPQTKVPGTIPQSDAKPTNKRKRRTCVIIGCKNVAQGNTDKCFSHGGGHRCQFKGCEKGARGCTGFCIRHGGGIRCKVTGCTSAARGKLGLCIAHGGNQSHGKTKGKSLPSKVSES